MLKRVTVFGASGFIGRHIVKRLAARGVVLRAAVRDPEAALFLKPMGVVGQIVPVAGDVRDEAAVAAAVDGADGVVNCVGLYVERGGAKFAAVHDEGARRVARLAAAAGVQRHVYFSGIGADPESPSSYIRARAAGETAVRNELPRATILRPSAVFGPGDHLFTQLARAAQLAPALPLFDGGTARIQPVYVGDVADAAVAALDQPSASGQVFELGGPAAYTYRELFELMLRTIGRRRLLVSVPSVAGKIMTALTGLLPNPPLTRDALELMIKDNVVAPDAKTLRDLGVTPTSAEIILPTYLDRYRRGSRFKSERPD